MGLLAFPAMLRAGYDVKIAAGVVCAGGCLGILIPPSVMLILYGATAGVSVVKLYAGAFFPGIMLAGLYILFTMIMALLNPKLAPKLPPEERNVPLRRSCWALVTSFLPLAGLIGAALGSIIVRARHAVGSRRHGLARRAAARASATAPTTRKRWRVLLIRPTACYRRAADRLPVRLRVHRRSTVGSPRASMVACVALTVVRRRSCCCRATLQARPAQGIGVPHRPHHRHGVLAVHRLVHVLGGVRLSRRPRADRAVRAGDEPHRRSAS